MLTSQLRTISASGDTFQIVKVLFVTTVVSRLRYPYAILSIIFGYRLLCCNSESVTFYTEGVPFFTFSFTLSISASGIGVTPFIEAELCCCSFITELLTIIAYCNVIVNSVFQWQGYCYI